MHIVVTGAAGFIGANLVKALNDRGEKRIIAVDNLARSEKVANLVDCEITEFVDKDDFLARLADGDFDDEIAAVLHQGACSDTLEADGRYMMRNNYRYSVSLLDWCQNNDVPFLYASSAAVYGGSGVFREERAAEAPLNVYGYSKFLFDQHVRRMLPERTAQIAGFRYFNVYGPREQHKGRGSSVAWHFHRQYRSEGCVRLFEGSGGYAAGDQRRDIVAVEDVDKVNLDFLDHPERTGIFILGSGTPGDWALGEFQGPVAAESRAWLDYLATGRACVLATPEDARRALEISLAIERSLKTGAAVKLPLANY